MNKALVGYTGFVGRNIAAQQSFDGLYNSKNIRQAYKTKPELLIYAGLPAEKYLANHEPLKDWELIIQAEHNIKEINPQKLVLISTIDVWRDSVGVTEETEIDSHGLHAYGYDRYCLECWVRENFPDALIIRLPGLFGEGLKKNFIYDLINVIPSVLTREKYEELSAKDVELKRYYSIYDDQFYKCGKLSLDEKMALKERFRNLGFTALNFTDSRNVYQFYPLQRLSKDIKIALEHDLSIWHPATEPIAAGELYQYLTGEEFHNILEGAPVKYGYKTLFAELFHGFDGYILHKNQIMECIRSFVYKGEKG